MDVPAMQAAHASALRPEVDPALVPVAVLRRVLHNREHRDGDDFGLPKIPLIFPRTIDTYVSEEETEVRGKLEELPGRGNHEGNTNRHPAR